METNENFVNVTENVVAATEEAPKTFTQADVDRMVKEKLDEVLPGKIARREAKIRREYESKYGDLENVLVQGTGQKDITEIANTFRDHYTQRGIAIEKRPAYSDKDDEVLAKADAEDIISSGFDEVVYEVDRLTKRGLDNMTAREKVLYKTLAEHRQRTERQQELSSIGVTAEEYDSQEFKDFAAMFDPRTPVKKIYETYAKTKPKKEIKPMGSMTGSTKADNGIKDYYSFEEASKFTKKDFDNNPALYEAVQKSMLKWKE